MTWKKIPGFGKEKDKNIEEQGKSLDTEKNENERVAEEKDLGFQEEPISTDMNPRNKDRKDRNKKVLLISGIILIIFSVLVYMASSSRPSQVPHQQEKEILMNLPQDDEEIQEATVIYSLKKEIEEIKEDKERKVEKISSNINYDNGNKKTFVHKEDISKAATNNTPNNLRTFNNSNKLYPPLPPDNPQGVIQPFQNLQPPVSFGKKDVTQQPVKYKLVVLESPFQFQSFKNRNDLKDNSFEKKENKNINAILDNTSDNLINDFDKEEDLSKKKEEKGLSSGKVTDSKDAFNLRKERKSRTFTIPAGSFFKVVLLNGVDAPTGMGGKASPYPVIARVLTDSVLPNRFFADMKGCFVLGEATGELSSERVIMRFTKISCVTMSGKVIEKNITGFIAGEDGKYGLIGRVVSKAGAQLGRVLLAKFVESAGNILTLQSQIVSTSGLGTVTTIDPEKAGESAVYSGFAGAAKTLSEYYLKLADQIFPVIEINAGRQGDVVLLRNLTINLDNDLKDNGSFIQRDGVLSDSDAPEDKVFKIEKEDG